MKKTNIKKSSAKTQSKASKVVKKVVEPTKTLVEELESMEQTTGKDYIQKTKELEDILGIKETNPFKTSNANLFQENLSEMTLVDMQSLAVRVGVMPSANKTNLKKRLMKEFEHRNKSKTVIGAADSRQVELDKNDPNFEEVSKFLREGM
jgi:hypothetical protein